MRRYASVKKQITLVLLASFTLTNAAFSAPVLPGALPGETTDLSRALTENLESILPRGAARVEQVEVPDHCQKENDPCRLVFYIQDAHANPEAQRNIQAVLKSLTQNNNALFGSPRIAVESAASALNPGILNLLPSHPPINQSVILDLAEKGELSGADLFLLDQDRDEKNPSRKEKRTPMPVMGVEDPVLFKQNLYDMRRLLADREAVDSELAKIKTLLARTKSHFLKGDLKKFDDEQSARTENRRSILPYLKSLSHWTETVLGIRLADQVEQLRFPNISRILYLEKLEKQTNQVKAGTEWQSFVLVLEQLAHQTGETRHLARDLKQLRHESEQSLGYDLSIGPRLVFERMMDLSTIDGLNQANYPEFFKRLTFLILQTEIESSELFREIEQLEREVMSRLAATPEEQALIGLDADFKLLRKLLRGELTRAEFDRIAQIEPRVSPNALLRRIHDWRKQVRGESDQPSFGAQTHPLTPHWVRAKRFYATAKQREQALAGRALRLIADSGDRDGIQIPFFSRPQFRSVILIAGGFHRDGIRSILRERGAAYAVISPRMLKEPDVTAYARVMLGKHANPAVLSELDAAKNSVNRADLLDPAASRLTNPLREDPAIGLRDLTVLTAYRDQIKRALSGGEMRIALRAASDRLQTLTSNTPRLELRSDEPFHGGPYQFAGEGDGRMQRLLENLTEQHLRPFVLVRPDNGKFIFAHVKEVYERPERDHLFRAIDDPEIVEKVFQGVTFNSQLARIESAISFFRTLYQAYIPQDYSKPHPEYVAFQTGGVAGGSLFTHDAMTDAVIEAAKFPGNLSSYRPLSNWLRKVMLSRPDDELTHVLDVGAGFGISMRLVNSIFSNLELTGLDIKQEPLRKIKEQGIKGNLVLGDGLRTTFPNRHFDVIMSHGLLRYVAGAGPGSLGQFAVELKRIIKDNGSIFMEDTFTSDKDVVPEFADSLRKTGLEVAVDKFGTTVHRHTAYYIMYYEYFLKGNATFRFYVDQYRKLKGDTRKVSSVLYDLAGYRKSLTYLVRSTPLANHDRPEFRQDWLSGIQNAQEALKFRNLEHHNVLVRIGVDLASGVSNRARNDAFVRQAVPISEFLVGKSASIILMPNETDFDPEFPGSVPQSFGPFTNIISEEFPWVLVPVSSRPLSINDRGLHLSRHDVSGWGIHMLENLQLARAVDFADPTSADRQQFVRDLANLSDGILIMDSLADLDSSAGSVVDLPKLLPEAYASAALIKQLRAFENLDAIILSGSQTDQMLTEHEVRRRFLSPHGLVWTEGKSQAGSRGRLQALLAELDKFQRGQKILFGIFNRKNKHEPMPKELRQSTRVIMWKLDELRKQGVQIIVIGEEATEQTFKLSEAERDSVLKIPNERVPFKILRGEPLPGLEALRRAPTDRPELRAVPPGRKISTLKEAVHILNNDWSSLKPVLEAVLTAFDLMRQHSPAPSFVSDRQQKIDELRSGKALLEEFRKSEKKKGLLAQLAEEAEKPWQPVEATNSLLDQIEQQLQTLQRLLLAVLDGLKEGDFAGAFTAQLAKLQQGQPEAFGLMSIRSKLFSFFSKIRAGHALKNMTVTTDQKLPYRLQAEPILSSALRNPAFSVPSGERMVFRLGNRAGGIPRYVKFHVEHIPGSESALKLSLFGYQDLNVTHKGQVVYALPIILQPGDAVTFRDPRSSETIDLVYAGSRGAAYNIELRSAGEIRAALWKNLAVSQQTVIEDLMDVFFGGHRRLKLNNDEATSASKPSDIDTYVSIHEAAHDIVLSDLEIGRRVLVQFGHHADGRMRLMTVNVEESRSAGEKFKVFLSGTSGLRVFRVISADEIRSEGIGVPMVGLREGGAVVLFDPAAQQLLRIAPSQKSNQATSNLSIHFHSDIGMRAMRIQDIPGVVRGPLLQELQPSRSPLEAGMTIESSALNFEVVEAQPDSISAVHLIGAVHSPTIHPYLLAMSGQDSPDDYHLTLIKGHRVIVYRDQSSGNLFMDVYRGQAEEGAPQKLAARVKITKHDAEDRKLQDDMVSLFEQERTRRSVSKNVHVNGSLPDRIKHMVKKMVAEAAALGKTEFKGIIVLPDETHYQLKARANGQGSSEWQVEVPASGLDPIAYRAQILMETAAAARPEFRMKLVGHGKYAVGDLVPGLSIPENAPAEGQIELDQTNQLVLYFPSLGKLGLVNFLESPKRYLPKLEFKLPPEVWVYEEGAEMPVDQSKPFVWREEATLHFTLPLEGDEQEAVLILEDLDVVHYDTTGGWRFYFEAGQDIKAHLPESYRANYFVESTRRIRVPLSSKALTPETTELYRFRTLNGDTFESVMDPGVLLVYPDDAKTVPLGNIIYRKKFLPDAWRENAPWREELEPSVDLEQDNVVAVIGLKLLQKYPNDADLLNLTAKALSKLGKLDEAENLANRVYEIPSSNTAQQTVAHQTLDAIYAEKIARFDAMKPNDEPVQRISGSSHVARGEHVASQAPPEVESAMIDQIRLLIAEGKSDEAYDVAEHAIAIHTKNVWLLNFAARIRVRRHRNAGAADLVGRVLRMEGVSDADRKFAEETLRLAGAEINPPAGKSLPADQIVPSAGLPAPVPVSGAGERERPEFRSTDLSAVPLELTAINIKNQNKSPARSAELYQMLLQGLGIADEEDYTSTVKLELKRAVDRGGFALPSKELKSTKIKGADWVLEFAWAEGGKRLIFLTQNDPNASIASIQATRWPVTASAEITSANLRTFVENLITAKEKSAEGKNGQVSPLTYDEFVEKVDELAHLYQMTPVSNHPAGLKHTFVKRFSNGSEIHLGYESLKWMSRQYAAVWESGKPLFQLTVIFDPNAESEKKFLTIVQIGEWTHGFFKKQGNQMVDFTIDRKQQSEILTLRVPAEFEDEMENEEVTLGRPIRAGFTSHHVGWKMDPVTNAVPVARPEFHSASRFELRSSHPDASHSNSIDRAIAGLRKLTERDPNASLQVSVTRVILKDKETDRAHIAGFQVVYRGDNGPVRGFVPFAERPQNLFGASHDFEYWHRVTKDKMFSAHLVRFDDRGEPVFSLAGLVTLHEDMDQAALERHVGKWIDGVVDKPEWTHQTGASRDVRLKGVWMSSNGVRGYVPVEEIPKIVFRRNMRDDWIHQKIRARIVSVRPSANDDRPTLALSMHKSVDVALLDKLEYAFQHGKPVRVAVVGLSAKGNGILVDIGGQLTGFIFERNLIIPGSVRAHGTFRERIDYFAKRPLWVIDAYVRDIDRQDLYVELSMSPPLAADGKLKSANVASLTPFSGSMTQVDPLADFAKGILDDVSSGQSSPGPNPRAELRSWAEPWNDDPFADGHLHESLVRFDDHQQMDQRRNELWPERRPPDEVMSDLKMAAVRPDDQQFTVLVHKIQRRKDLSPAGLEVEFEGVRGFLPQRYMNVPVEAFYRVSQLPPLQVYIVEVKTTRRRDRWGQTTVIEEPIFSMIKPSLVSTVKSFVKTSPEALGELQAAHEADENQVFRVTVRRVVETDRSVAGLEVVYMSPSGKGAVRGFVPIRELSRALEEGMSKYAHKAEIAAYLRERVEGQEFQAVILNFNDRRPEQIEPIFSFRQVESVESDAQVMKVFYRSADGGDDAVVTATITRAINPGLGTIGGARFIGLEADVEGAGAFIPSSEVPLGLLSGKKPADLVGQSLQARVINVRKFHDRKQLVLSLRLAAEESRSQSELFDELQSAYQRGEALQAIVSGASQSRNGINVIYGGRVRGFIYKRNLVVPDSAPGYQDEDGAVIYFGNQPGLEMNVYVKKIDGDYIEFTMTQPKPRADAGGVIYRSGDRPPASSAKPKKERPRRGGLTYNWENPDWHSGRKELRQSSELLTEVTNRSRIGVDALGLNASGRAELGRVVAASKRLEFIPLEADFRERYSKLAGQIEARGITRLSDFLYTTAFTSTSDDSDSVETSFENPSPVSAQVIQIVDAHSVDSKPLEDVLLRIARENERLILIVRGMDQAAADTFRSILWKEMKSLVRAHDISRRVFNDQLIVRAASQTLSVDQLSSAVMKYVGKETKERTAVVARDGEILERVRAGFRFRNNLERGGMIQSEALLKVFEALERRDLSRRRDVVDLSDLMTDIQNAFATSRLPTVSA